MLTKEDYCDYETCVALKELGFNTLVDWYFNENKIIVSPLARCRSTSIPRISLYEAQKWLREEKGIFLDVGLFNDGVFYYCIRQKEYNYWREIYRSFFHDGLFDDRGKFDSYEEALFEGIKEAVKILKE